MEVIKRDGTSEEFNEQKFLNSLEKAGFSDLEIKIALEKTKESLYDGITTDLIYEKAWETLKNIQNVEPIVKYSLKRAILELGPSGFPFEQLVAKIYQELGYKTLTGIMLEGKCIDHEIDVIAYKENELLLIEAKFHNEQSMKSDTKVALYVKARFDDLINIKFDIDGKKRKMTRGVLITNTGFTNNSKKYIKCVDTFDMISWSYPKDQGLLKMIEDHHIHPITSIPKLSQREKGELIEAGYIYCKDILKNPNILDQFKIVGEKKNEILKFARIICNEK